MRDPRVDPRPGDVLIYGPQWQRERAEVMKLSGRYVDYFVNGQMAFCTTEQWSVWMEDAEVLHVAAIDQARGKS